MMLFPREPGDGDGTPRGVGLYIAGPSAGWQWCNELVKSGLHMGYSITHDWTREFVEPANKIVGMLWPATPAEQDKTAVMTCDAVVARVLPFISTTGMWFEMGLAVGLGKPVIAWLDYTNPLSVNKAECMDDQNLYLLRVQDWFSKQVFLHLNEIRVVLRHEDLWDEVYNHTHMKARNRQYTNG